MNAKKISLLDFKIKTKQNKIVAYHARGSIFKYQRNFQIFAIDADMIVRWNKKYFRNF